MLEVGCVQIQGKGIVSHKHPVSKNSPGEDKAARDCQYANSKGGIVGENSTEQKLRQILGEYLQKDLTGVPGDQDLIDYLGLDSISGLNLLALVEKRFQVRFDDEILASLRSIEKLCDGILQAQKR